MVLLATASVLLCQAPSASLAPFCIILALLVYTAIIRPYRLQLDNIRKTLSLVCLLGVLGQRLYFQYLYDQGQKQDIASATVMMACTCFGSAVVVAVGLAAMVYEIVR